MVRTLIALAVVALAASDASAGPIRNIIDRVRERRAERIQARVAPCHQAPAAATCSACPAAAPVPRAAPADCPDGTCPLRRPVAAAPAVVVFDTPRRMP